MRSSPSTWMTCVASTATLYILYKGCMCWCSRGWQGKWNGMQALDVGQYTIPVFMRYLSLKEGCASLYPEIGKSSTKWSSSFGILMAERKSIRCWQKTCCPLPTGQRQMLWTEMCCCTFCQIYVFATSHADSPILAIQTMVPSVVDGNYVPANH